jgi:methylase of polypeptide subunit release factors
MKNNKGEIRIVKDSVVLTPPVVAQYIYDEVKRKPFKTILDIGCHTGNLSKLFHKKANTNVIGLDIDDTHKDNFDMFVHKDFLTTTKEDFEGLSIDLIVSNPPFQKHSEFNELYPFLFYEHVKKLFGDMPTILIVSGWLLSNSSKRMEKLNQYNITKVCTLHKNIFNIPDNNNISVESSILFFNIKVKKAHHFLDFKVLNPKIKPHRKYRTVALNNEQTKFLEAKKLKNFNQFIKDLIKQEYDEFPV